MTKAPRQIVAEQSSLKTKTLLIINVFLGIEMILVILIYMVVPLFINHDIIAWVNSSSLWAFVFGLFLPAILIVIVNGKFEPIYKEHFENNIQNRTLSCYCCDKNYNESEMKTLHICKNCVKDQKVE